MPEPVELLEIRLFALAADRAGASTVELDCPAGFSVGMLRKRLVSELPSLAGLIDRCGIAVNHEYAEDDVPLIPGDEVAVLPPVTGG